LLGDDFFIGFMGKRAIEEKGGGEFSNTKPGEGH
jgi:hypothetical protein